MMKEVIAVDPDCSSVERVGEPDGGAQALGVDGGREAVWRIVGELQGLLLVLELCNRADGPKDFFPHDLHVGSHVGEDGRLDEVALVSVTAAARENRGALCLAQVDIAHDALILQIADEGALEGFLQERVPDLVLLCPLLERLDKLVVNTLLHQNPAARAADLAVVEVDSKVDPVDGLFDVGIVEDDVGRLAA